MSEENLITLNSEAVEKMNNGEILGKSSKKWLWVLGVIGVGVIVIILLSLLTNIFTNISIFGYLSDEDSSNIEGTIEEGTIKISTEDKSGDENSKVNDEEANSTEDTNGSTENDDTTTGEDQTENDETNDTIESCADDPPYIYEILEGGSCKGGIRVHVGSTSFSCCDVSVDYSTDETDFIKDFKICQDNDRSITSDIFGGIEIVQYNILGYNNNFCQVRTTLIQTNYSQYKGSIIDCDYNNTLVEDYPSEENLVGQFVFGAQNCVGDLDYLDFILSI